eukprot:scaffold32801_cov66-Phaeocystis_antarctica.AAC.4
MPLDLPQGVPLHYICALSLPDTILAYASPKATASYHLDPNLNSQARQGAAVNRTLVLLGAAAILGAIITQPSAFGHR